MMDCYEALIRQCKVPLKIIHFEISIAVRNFRFRKIVSGWRMNKMFNKRIIDWILGLNVFARYSNQTVSFGLNYLGQQFGSWVHE